MKTMMIPLQEDNFMRNRFPSNGQKHIERRKKYNDCALFATIVRFTMIMLVCCTQSVSRNFLFSPRTDADRNLPRKP